MSPIKRRGRLCKMQPMVAIPNTRATTSQRMGRVCVNIAANGSNNPPMKRRRRRHLTTIITTPSLMYPSPFEHKFWNRPDNYGQVDDGPQQIGRLVSGQDYTIYKTELLADNNTGNGIHTSSQETLCSNSTRLKTHSVYQNKSVTQHTIKTLKSIVESMEKNFEDEEHTNSDREPDPEQGDKSFQSSQLHILTKLIRETNEKLDNYILSQAEQHAAIMSTSPLMQMNLLGRFKGGRHRPLSVLPLFVQTTPPAAALTSTLPQLPAPYPAAGQPEGCDPINSRPRLCRTYQRDRRRRRPLRSAYIHLENRSSNTDDLDILPRILMARTPGGSVLAGSESIAQSLRDSGTTMWCPMKCCRQRFCGVAKNESAIPPLEEKEKILTPVPYPMQPSPRTIETTIEYDDDSEMSPPPLPKTPPPRDRMQKEEIYRVSSRSYDFSIDGCLSRSSSQDLIYPIINGRPEDDLHEWYSNMDVMEHCFREDKPQVKTSNKQLQTKIESTASTTSTSDIHFNHITTIDKAVSTTELQDEIVKPISEVQVQSKTFCPKPQRGKKVNLQLDKAPRSEIKVKFAKKLNTEITPKMTTVGTNPILVSSAMQMPSVQQNRIQKLNSAGSTLKRKTIGKQETEESTWYRQASGSYHIPPFKGYPTGWN